jgi:transposase InsO family protein
MPAWRIEYNEERPHSSLGSRKPKESAATQAADFYRLNPAGISRFASS